jgi:hypothetical protein
MCRKKINAQHAAEDATAKNASFCSIPAISHSHDIPESIIMIITLLRTTTAASESFFDSIHSIF